MPEPDNNRLQKAMKGIVIGTVQDLQDFEKEAKLNGLQEVEEQLWVDFAGRAEEFAAWSMKELEFVNHFVDATGQRDSPFDRPHFTFGSVVDTPTPVVVSAVVMAYKTNERNETVGANVALGILASDLSVNVRGRVNLTFQGYGQEPSGLSDDIGVN